MKKIEKELIIGVIKSATHKAAKIIEKGKLVTDWQFHEILEKCNKYDHLFFWVLKIEIVYGREHYGKPSVEITLKVGDYLFMSRFLLTNPPGTFSNQTPFAQSFEVFEIEECEEDFI